MSTPTQDLPPAEGFEPISYRRHLPKKGPPGWVLLAGGFGMIMGGLFLHSKGCRITIELERERRQARLNLLPLLQAEADLQYLAKREESLRLEAEIMKDNPKWEVGKSVYNSDSYRHEAFLLRDFRFQ